MNRQIGRPGHGDEHAAGFHEVLEVQHAFEPESPAHVVGGRLPADVGRDLGGLPRDRVVALQAAHDAHGVAAMLAHDDHVVVARQLRVVAHFVHRDVVEGDAVLVQPEPEPAFVLRVGPGVHDRDARDPGLVKGDVEFRARAVGGEAVLRARQIEDRAEIDLRVVLLTDSRTFRR